MVKIAVGSTNPTKEEAIRIGFSHFFNDIEIHSFPAPSGIHHQPIGEETFKGAEHRVDYLIEHLGKEFDFFCAIEGGVDRIYGEVMCFGVACISDGRKKAFAISPAFSLPKKVGEEVMKRKELGPLMDALTGVKGMKRGQGAVGFFTNGKITRAQLYVPAVILALSCFFPPLTKLETD